MKVDAVERHRKLVVDVEVLHLHSCTRLLVPWLPHGSATVSDFIQDYAVRSIHVSESRRCIDCAHRHDRPAQGWHTMSCRRHQPSPSLHSTSCQRERSFSRRQTVKSPSHPWHCTLQQVSLTVDRTQHHSPRVRPPPPSIDPISSRPIHLMALPKVTSLPQRDIDASKHSTVTTL